MTMDVIKIEDLEIFANHGVFQEEKEKGTKSLQTILHLNQD